MIPKFRAWDREKDRMIYPSTTGVCFELNDDGISVLDIDVDYPNDYGFPKIASILMQSTGLEDKNGVEIFEGDIIKNSNGLTGYVTYLQQEAGFVVVLKKSDYRLGHRNTGESYAEATNHEVIGNIYENPELLDSDLVEVER
ncbi:YopX family protein [Enterococcus mundtii]|uniref:YopX family protein n=1 Tax=Enterococcus mundtii TaxID=53346 RepID=UPI002DB5EA2F|nr:YopX family protein [Enterococcus mundtii]MEC3942746.1 YopX family protein [Enterococcus mundtii]